MRPGEQATAGWSLFGCGRKMSSFAPALVPSTLAHPLLAFGPLGGKLGQGRIPPEEVGILGVLHFTFVGMVHIFGVAVVCGAWQGAQQEASSRAVTPLPIPLCSADQWHVGRRRLVLLFVVGLGREDAVLPVAGEWGAGGCHSFVDRALLVAWGSGQGRPVALAARGSGRRGWRVQLTAVHRCFGESEAIPPCPTCSPSGTDCS